MQKYFIFFSVWFLCLPINFLLSKERDSEELVLSESQQLYTEMELEHVVNYTAFEYAVTGYQKLNAKNKDVVTLIDFSKPSTEERLYVLDMKQKKILYSTHVSHGKNSGGNYATSFSNERGSNKSSLGFFITENTYQGKHGYSLIIDGLEKGINDRAKERAIVIHSATYADPSVIASAGRLGRSFGCPALPKSISKTIIDTIKEGTLIFIYADDQDYFDQSTIL
ncbi:MAG: murein L,D-transpeptidase catalytic domain family protein [Bacteroidales bacterium]|jgi:hypothetical protein|nr:murein L,D-transpeptidase catalytic domain family protein [Bacteroidales bacterium]